MSADQSTSDDPEPGDISAAHLIRLLDELPDAVVVMDDQGQLQWANHTAERMLGQPADEWKGHSTLGLVHPEDLELVLRSLESIQNKEIGTPIEVRVRAPSGWRLMELIGSPVAWLKEGAVLLCLRDLTERRRFDVARDNEARFRSLIQNAATVTILVSPDGVIESVSGALNRVLGHDPELVEHRALAELVIESDRPALHAAFERAARGASAANPVTVAVHMLRHGGTEVVPFGLSLVNLIDDPTVEGYVVSGHDITDQAAAELELRKTLSLLTATLDSTTDGILVVDTEGQVTTFNRQFADMWKLPDSVLAMRDARQLALFVSDQLVSPGEFSKRLIELTRDTEAVAVDTLEFTDGRVFERYVTPQHVSGETIGRVWSFRDVTERKQFEEELSFQAFHDSLTGLANKALFLERLQTATDRSERRHDNLAVMFLDVDDFKTVNDSLGHSVGDALLQSMAHVLLGCLRETDTAARFGGDEFAVLVDDIGTIVDVTGLAERILTAFRSPMTVGIDRVSATVSIGIAFDSPGTTSDQLLRHADLAMYAAKERGKNCYAEFEDQMRADALSRLEARTDAQPPAG
jgi:diguanylate cyclase (GGDEF)-like protein/PAS domain S-box-containing protein